MAVPPRGSAGEPVSGRAGIGGRGGAQAGLEGHAETLAQGEHGEQIYNAEPDQPVHADAEDVDVGGRIAYLDPLDRTRGQTRLGGIAQPCEPRAAAPD